MEFVNVNDNEIEASTPSSDVQNEASNPSSDVVIEISNENIRIEEEVIDENLEEINEEINEVVMKRNNDDIDQTNIDVLIKQLMEMGFSENGCKRAVQATGYEDADTALNWIFEHMHDDDFNIDPNQPDISTSLSSLPLDHLGNIEDIPMKSIGGLQRSDSTGGIEVCAICLELPALTIKLNHCKHSFCYTCILRWDKRQNDILSKSCPTCRGPYNLSLALHDQETDQKINDFLLDNEDKMKVYKERLELSIEEKKKTIPNNEWSDNLAKIISNDLVDQLDATKFFRRKLSNEHNPPIQQVINDGLVPIFVNFIRDSTSTDLQFEACWSLTNIVSGTSANCECVVNAGAIPIFIDLLGSRSEVVSEQAAWALGNVAGDSIRFRDRLHGYGIVPAMVRVAEQFCANSALSSVRNFVWCMSNLCRGKPVPELHIVRPFIPLLFNYLTTFSHDNEIITDVCWTLSYVSDGSNNRIAAIIESGVVPMLVAFLDNPATASKIVTPTLRTIGNLVTGDDTQTQTVIDLNIIPVLKKIIDNHNSNLRKEAFWTLSNIAAGNQAQIQIMIDSDIFPKIIINTLSIDGEAILKEIAWVLCNTITGGSNEQIHYLVNIDVLGALFYLLHHMLAVRNIFDIIVKSLCEILLKSKSSLEHYNKIKNEFENCQDLKRVESHLQSFGILSEHQELLKIISEI